jgi:pimeloyl-ACP methyl ester carboxylesterase
MAAFGAERSGTESGLTKVYEWRPRDMNPNVEQSIEVKLDSRTSECAQEPCTFDVHYFFGKRNTRDDPRPLNILFIAGGPGHIVDRAKRDLWFMEGFHNVVYFDMRGAGFSAVPKSNSFDRFLRAEHIASDIERIRQTELPKIPGSEIRAPWDAIYGHSYGTVVAQIYASKYGKEAVRKVILSAPIARSLDDVTDISENKGTEAARISTVLANLMNIYQQYRETPCGITRDSLGILNVVARMRLHEILTAAVHDKKGKVFIDGTNNFCFVDADQVQNIETTLATKLRKLVRKYGSISFASRYYDELIESDPQFILDYPYPREFFIALQALENLGTPVEEFQKQGLADLSFDDKLKTDQVNAALFLGYQLLPHGNQECDEAALFLKNLIPEGVLGPGSYRNLYCDRYIEAKKTFEPRRGGSSRASLVFGLNDGVSRWVFARLKERLDGRGCLFGNGKDIKDFAANPNTDEATRKVLQKLGIDADVPICLWNPKEYSHSVTTLILKGQADPITAGCQAEDVFQNGLNGERAFVEFPGVGHFMMLPIVQDEAHKKDPTRHIIDHFKIVNGFLDATTISAFKEELDATILPALRAKIKIALDGERESIGGC